MWCSEWDQCSERCMDAGGGPLNVADAESLYSAASSIQHVENNWQSTATKPLMDTLVMHGSVQHAADSLHNTEYLDMHAETLVDSPTSWWDTEAKTLHHHHRIGDHLNGIIFGDYRYFPLMSSTSVPSFWSITFGEGPPDLPLVLFWQIISAIVFGAVHCLVWNTGFSSIMEMWMWRVSAAWITGFPLLCLVLLWTSNKFQHGSVPRGVFTYTNYGLMALYVVAKVALLILPFTALQDLPQPMFKAIKWHSVFKF
ncbi:hypothetical protein B0H14DRAFT_419893 [Mycena olivaceomarginata]|nr:hypothetical protein B0H14DRAFT_419893 [Mycena olivaceomarginata]